MSAHKKKKVWFRIVLNEGAETNDEDDAAAAADAWVVAVDPAGLRLTLVSDVSSLACLVRIGRVTLAAYASLRTSRSEARESHRIDAALLPVHLSSPIGGPSTHRTAVQPQ